MPLLPSDFLAIERLYAEYNRAIHRADSIAWTSCFTADGVFSNIFRKVQGAAALQVYAEDFTTDRGTRYLINNLVIAPVGDGAAGTCYLLIPRIGPGSEPPHVELSGIYSDELVRQNGQWKFARRHIQRDL